MHASDFRYFSDIDVSQGSATTYLRCGGIVAYLLLNLAVKNFGKSVNIWQSY